MANKAAKQQAARNKEILKNAHLITLGNNVFFVLLRLIYFHARCTRNTYLLFALLSAPAWGVEYWFEKVGRPTITPNGEILKKGEDLEAPGLTEFMWDVLYWTWACVATAAMLGNRAWWMYLAVPIYSMWMLSSIIMGFRKGMGGATAQGDGGGQSEVAGGDSKRQKKLEKRGGQKTQYR